MDRFFLSLDKLFLTSSLEELEKFLWVALFGEFEVSEPGDLWVERSADGMSVGISSKSGDIAAIARIKECVLTHSWKHWSDERVKAALDAADAVMEKPAG